MTCENAVLYHIAIIFVFGFICSAALGVLSTRLVNPEEGGHFKTNTSSQSARSDSHWPSQWLGDWRILIGQA